LTVSKKQFYTKILAKFVEIAKSLWQILLQFWFWHFLIAHVLFNMISYFYLSSTTSQLHSNDAR